MLFTNDTIKYCLLTWDHLENSHVSNYITSLPVTGLFNWSLIFNGVRTFPRTSEDFDKYNIIHINITQKNLPLLTKIIPKINRNITKILINVDYAIEMWSQAFPHPELFLFELDKADYIFAVEPSMADLLSVALKRPVPCIPHPCATHLISKYLSKERQKKIMISAHRYDNNYLLPYFVTRELPPHWISTILGADSNFNSCLHLYDECQQQLTFEESIKYISSQYAIIETHTMSTFGRVAVEAAVLGVPCICPLNIEASHQCFPSLLYSNFHHPVSSIKKLLNKLIDDSGFYSEVAKLATERSYFYSYENCNKMMLNFLNSYS